jgi:catalase
MTDAEATAVGGDDRESHRRDLFRSMPKDEQERLMDAIAGAMQTVPAQPQNFRRPC